MAEEEIPRDRRWAVPLFLLAVGILAVFWVWGRPTIFAFGLISAAIAAVFVLFYLGLSYNGSRSKLYGLKPVTTRMPAVGR